MNKNESYSIEIIRYSIPSPTHIEFERSYHEAVKSLESSPYCRGYSIIKGVEEPDNYMLTIYWTSVEDHLQKFRDSAEFAGFFRLVKPFYSFIQEMKHYEPPLLSWEKRNTD